MNCARMCFSKGEMSPPLLPQKQWKLPPLLNQIGSSRRLQFHGDKYIAMMYKKRQTQRHLSLNFEKGGRPVFHRDKFSHGDVRASHQPLDEAPV